MWEMDVVHMKNRLPLFSRYVQKKQSKTKQQQQDDQSE
jgi:hypothetical protein